MVLQEKHLFELGLLNMFNSTNSANSELKGKSMQLLFWGESLQSWRVCFYDVVWLFLTMVSYDTMTNKSNVLKLSVSSRFSPRPKKCPGWSPGLPTVRFGRYRHRLSKYLWPPSSVPGTSEPLGNLIGKTRLCSTGKWWIQDHLDTTETLCGPNINL